MNAPTAASANAATTKKPRLLHIDCMRGLACLFMFQTHCYDAWLEPSLRHTRFFYLSQFASTPAATSFLFLVGVSLGLGVDSTYRKGASSTTVAASVFRRGTKILLLAYLFRAQELLRRDWMSKWTNLLRVDVLNAIGISIVLLGLVCLIRDRRKRGLVAVLVAGTISLLTPMIWTDWRPSWLPWYLESYINGVDTFDKPQSWLFPIFPWSAFCFAGLAFAALLASKRVISQEPRSMKLLAVGGMLLIAAAILMDYSPVHIYPHYDFWRTSPNFFLARIGFLLLLFSICYRWAIVGVGKWFFARTVELGQHSLLVYWVHIWFVYGSFSILPHKNSSIAMATVGLIAITVFMTVLAGQSERITGFVRHGIAKMREKRLAAAA